MYILVTGGAGYIGSHVCKALSLAGYQPIAYDNLSLGHDWAVKWGPLVEGDIRDHDLLLKTCTQYQPSGVIHLAGLSNVRESHRYPLRYYQNNVTGTLTLLDVLREKRVPYFVFSSTCSIYGMPQKVPLDESHPKVPINTYGQTKWMIEQILQTASQTYGMKVAALRYFNAAGADPESEIGEAHDPETHLIPLLLQTGLKQRKHFTLFGANHETPDGTPIRDFIHVTDLAEAHIKALEWMMKHGRSITLNLGTGRGYSVREVIATIEKELECTLPIEKSKRFPGDPPTLIANPQKARNILNWEPKLSSLSKTIETAGNWHRR